MRIDSMAGHGLNYAWARGAARDYQPTTRPGSARDGSGPSGVLILLQIVGIGWIVVNQFRDPIATLAGGRIGVVDKGYLGAALFFFAEGSLLLERLEAFRTSGRSSYLQWIGERLAWLYPLHGLILFGFVVAVASPIGAIPQHPQSFSLDDLLAHLTLTQAWGVARNDSWNFPSWLVSAEWGLVLALPLVASLLKRRPTVMAALAATAFVAGTVIAGRLGREFADLTTFGILQAVPAAVVGAAARGWSSSTAPSVAIARMGAAASLSWSLVATGLRLPDLVIWPALGAFVSLVVKATPLTPVKATMPLLVAGRAAVALQLIYLPTEIVFRRLSATLREPGSLSAVDLGLLAVMITIVAALAHRAVQKPAYRWLTSRSAPAPAPPSRPSGVDGAPS